MTTNMTTARATEIITGCVSQDVDNEGLEEILTIDADVAVANWRKYSAEAGDAETVAAIDAVGLDRAAGIYERALIAIEQAST